MAVMKRLALACTILVACGGDDGGDSDGGDSDGNLVIDAPIEIDAPPGVPASMRFYGTGTAGADRIEIAIDPDVPADIGAGDFTIDLWLRRGPMDSLTPTCTPGADNWITGNIVLDRDVQGSGRSGDYGLSLFGTGLAFGASVGTSAVGLCGATALASGWHHVAVTRDATTREIRLYLDGVQDGSVTGPAGDMSYLDGSTGAAKDPFLVIGAEKHDAGPQYPSFNGFVAEVRLSTVVRWTADFTPATEPYTLDADTAALYHFDEGGGAVLGDARGASPGVVEFGLDNTGSEVPAWASASPFVH